jgi:hypothetical protein
MSDQSALSQWIPIISLGIALLAVIVGPTVTLMISSRQIELSRRIANRQVIAPMRQAWIENVRVKLAEFLSLALHCWNRAVTISSFDALDDAEYKRLLGLGVEIELLINPMETDHKELLSAMTQCTRALAQGIEHHAEFSLGRERVGALGQKIFKTEWNRVKAEIEKP